MQAAVEAGFQQAGIAFKKTTGEKDMPAITGRTHDEITRRFEALYKKLAKQSAEKKAEAAGEEPTAQA